MADVIQLRRDTPSAWQSVNPILAQGELGIVLGSRDLKVGDGVTAWNDLPTYFSPAWFVGMLQSISELDARATATEQGISVLDARTTATEQGISDIEILALAGL